MSTVSVAVPSLQPEHTAMLASIRLSVELQAAAGIYGVTDSEARDIGFQCSSASDLSGIVFPYFDPETLHRTTARLRRDRPESDGMGKAGAKYLSPYGDNRHLYFPPDAAFLLRDMSVPVVIVEAEKSALALTALSSRTGRKLFAVGTGGCWGWRGKTGIETGPTGEHVETRGALADLGRISWEERIAIVCFDANSRTNLRVQAARRALAVELLARGAVVKIVNLPQQDGVNGPDDLIGACGDSAMLALLDSAQFAAETATHEAESAVSALEANKQQEPLSALDAIATVADQLQRTRLIGRLTALRIPGLTKEVLQENIQAQIADSQLRRKEVIARAEQERLLRLPIEPSQLIADLEKYYANRPCMPEGTALVEALFCLNTYVFDVFDTTPYLLYESATGGCGKTTALEFHAAVCARAYLGIDPSPAVVYRRIERDRPTYLLDEARILQTRGDRSQELLTLFDGGYKRGATVSRCEDHGNELRAYAVYCPKVLAKIGGFKGTLLDRGIVIHLEKAPGLPQTRQKVLAREAAPLKEKLEAYALQFRAKLERLYDDEPDITYWPAFSGRESEVWGPLLSHARLANTGIERRAHEVALRFSRSKAEIAITEDRNLALAQEALEILEASEGDSFRPAELLAALSGKEAWGEHLDERKTDKAKVSALGRFFRYFRLKARHTASGSEYSRPEAIQTLTRHVPVRQASPSVKVSEIGAILAESGTSMNDTSENEVSAEVSVTQGNENIEVPVPDDTMTPLVPGIEEEL
jgi:hypothetical protein